MRSRRAAGGRAGPPFAGLSDVAVEARPELAITRLLAIELVNTIWPVNLPWLALPFLATASDIPLERHLAGRSCGERQAWRSDSPPARQQVSGNARLQPAGRARRLSARATKGGEGAGARNRAASDLRCGWPKNPSPGGDPVARPSAVANRCRRLRWNDICMVGLSRGGARSAQGPGRTGARPSAHEGLCDFARPRGRAPDLHVPAHG